MEEKKEERVIDVREIWKAIKAHKKLYYKVLPIVFVASCVWILPQPRYYVAAVSLAPETSGENLGGGLSSIAATFGINVGNMQNNDAIYPLLYPDLFQSPEFLVGLLDIEVTTSDGELTTDYYTYLLRHRQPNWLTKPFTDAVKWVKRQFKKADTNQYRDENGRINPFRMSEEDHSLLATVQDLVSCSVDKKTDVTTISVQDQDPLVCATMADSVKQRLQDFIIRYRTSKARLDMDYYRKLTDSARVEYTSAARAYSDYCDTHKDVILQAYISRRSELEEDMYMKQNTYKAMSSQLESMVAKVQECTPAFTTLQSASVPVKPDGPKRVIFVAAMLILATICVTAYAARDALITKSNKN